MYVLVRKIIEIFSLPLLKLCLSPARSGNDSKASGSQKRLFAGHVHSNEKVEMCSVMRKTGLILLSIVIYHWLAFYHPLIDLFFDDLIFIKLSLFKNILLIFENFIYLF